MATRLWRRRWVCSWRVRRWYVFKAFIRCAERSDPSRQPAPGRIIYDPFVGTGSLLYSCAHWGAYVLGSDIDGRQMRGKGQCFERAESER